MDWATWESTLYAAGFVLFMGISAHELGSNAPHSRVVHFISTMLAVVVLSMAFQNI